MTGLIQPDRGSITGARHLARAIRSGSCGSPATPRSTTPRRAARPASTSSPRSWSCTGTRAAEAGGTGLEGAGARRPDRCGAPQGGRLLQGHAPARAAGPGHRARPGGAGARRAAQRTRSAGARRDHRAVPRATAADGRHVILSSHVLQEVDVISDQVILIANGMIAAEGEIRSVREEMHEHPSQFLLRCRGRLARRVPAVRGGPRHRGPPERGPARAAGADPQPRGLLRRRSTRIALDGHRDRERDPRRRERRRAVRVPDRRRVMMTSASGCGRSWTIARLEMRRAFFSKRAFWVYLLALFPAVIFIGHGLERQDQARPLAARGITRAALSGFRPGGRIGRRGDRPRSASRLSDRRLRPAPATEASPIVRRRLQYFDGSRQRGLTFKNGVLESKRVAAARQSRGGPRGLRRRLPALLPPAGRLLRVPGHLHEPVPRRDAGQDAALLAAGARCAGRCCWAASTWRVCWPRR